MSDRIKLLIWGALVVMVLLLLTLIEDGELKIFKKGSFLESNIVQADVEEFYEKLGPVELNQLNIIEAKEKITVTEEEIEKYRFYYGSQSNQIESIKIRYEQLIEEAQSQGDDKQAESLRTERENKIADIEKNFTSDEYVEKKIKQEKEQLLDQYDRSLKQTSLSPILFYYEMVNRETGEKFSSGDIEEEAFYEKSFTSENGYYEAHSILENGDFYYEALKDAHSIYLGNEETVRSELALYQQPNRYFEGKVIIPKSVITTGWLSNSYKEHQVKKYSIAVLFLLGIIAIILLFTRYSFNKDWLVNNNFQHYYEKLRFEIQLFLFGVPMIALYLIMYDLKYSLVSFFIDSYQTSILMISMKSVLAIISVIFIAYQLVYFSERWKQLGIFKSDLQSSYTLSFITAVQAMFLRRSLGIQFFILLIGFFLAGIGSFLALLHPLATIGYIGCVLFLGLPVLYIFVRKAGYLTRIIKQTEDMANGKLHEEIEVRGKSVLAQHAHNLNNLREGVRQSMTEQAKSERLKTELITNVSHDLRTPLTSIITYTDLLKNDKLTVEDRNKYLAIVEQKSARLKTLIEDLFEVSKMASGNLQLNKQYIDLQQLLQQALGEYEEHALEQGFDIKVTYPEEQLIALIDGQRFWRVLDNLIQNALKYSLANTRIYLSMRRENDFAEFVVKNITKYELPEDVEELFERFKRADTSRQTEGSGLGLAIVQSIVEMHGGSMHLEVDGDLFKVTVKVPLM